MDKCIKKLQIKRMKYIPKVCMNIESKVANTHVSRIPEATYETGKPLIFLIQRPENEHQVCLPAQEVKSINNIER